MNTKDAKILHDAIINSGYKPNDWEHSFLGNVTGHKAISNKQARILEQIYAKAFGGGIYQGR